MQNDDINTNQRDQDDGEIVALLKDYPMPDANAGFFDQALMRATHEGTRRQRYRWVFAGFGSAAAAGVLLWIIGGFLLNAPITHTPDATPDQTSGQSIAGVTMTLEEPRTINLVFAAAESMDGATLTVSLPDGIEMSGFPGQREITWQTSLDAGKNLLPLRLIATSPMGGEVLATLRHDDRGRTFRLRVDVS